MCVCEREREKYIDYIKWERESHIERERKRKWAMKDRKKIYFFKWERGSIYIYIYIYTNIGR